METTVLDNVLCPQLCWKMMLETCKMRKLVDNLTTEEGRITECEFVQIHLDEDLKSFTYKIEEKEIKIDISSISNISSDKAKSQSFSVELKTGLKMTFIAFSTTLIEYWIHGLQILKNNQKTRSLGSERRNQWLRKHFQALSTSDHHVLEYRSVYEKVLNCKHTEYVTEDFFKQKLKEFLKTKKLKYKEDEGFIHVKDFVEFYKYIFDRKEIQTLFNRIASNGAFISLTDLQYFLSKEQNESITQERCKEIIVTYEVTQVGKENLELNIDGFTHFLVSVHGQIFNQDHDRVYQDMNQPLPHYYIASSHNTYLCGRQLRGYSSAQNYSDAIEKGCRCVELDCWDGDDDEPIVYHGYTFTTKIPFKDIIKAIDKSAFKTSPYPLIVSLENHCSLEVQKKMASYMLDIFGDKMYTIPVDKTLDEFPSPEFFKYKLFIRGKVDKVDDEDNEENGAVQSDLEQEKEGKENKQEEMEEKRNSEAELMSSKDADDNIAIPSDNANTTQFDVPSPSSRRRKSSLGDSKKKFANELSDLINYVTNSKFLGFEDSSKSAKFWHSSSFVEGDMLFHADKNALKFIALNRKQLSRIYPGGMRIDSSNYNPINAWNVGCQIVALNHQTDDEGMALHYGKFRQNGKAGYVLKPHFLRDPSSKFDPNQVIKPSKVLRMKIISGQQLPEQPDSWALTKDEPDPYVQVQIFGVPVDEFSFTTSTYYDNSFNPTWNESFETKIHTPELIMVKFSVFDKDVGFDDFIGQAIIPFESLQQGYRHVALESKEGVALPCASIFVHVRYEDFTQDPPFKEINN